MASVSRPLLGVLLATVLAAGLWVVALRPSSSSAPAAKPASAVAKPASAVAKPATVAVKPARTAAPGPPVRPPTRAVPAVTSSGPAEVTAALRSGRVVAVLFYNPAGADDRAVKAELDALKLPRTVLRLAVPISQVSRYLSLTAQVSITAAPTLVIVDRSHQATELVGFADGYELMRRIAGAVAAAPWGVSPQYGG